MLTTIYTIDLLKSMTFVTSKPKTDFKYYDLNSNIFNLKLLFIAIWKDN